MKKQELVLKLVSMYEVKNCVIRRVYGVSNGVGYDLDVTVMNNATGELHLIKAHANNHGWFYPSHLRPNNPPYQYTGKCDRYQSRVVNAWVNELYPLFPYFNEFKKSELLAILEKGL